jgi:hypothetical protein
MGRSAVAHAQTGEHEQMRQQRGGLPIKLAVEHAHEFHMWRVAELIDGCHAREPITAIA